MTNFEIVQQTLSWLQSHGVIDLCVCPGGRNSPFITYLEKCKDFRVHSGFDERATSFFAIGLAQKTARPVAVLTTSGTAVAEVLPAVMEAHYTGTPLVVISADRPRRLRGTGAPQTVEQVNLFGSYVENCVDIEGEWQEPKWSALAPLHFNICFDEPLLQGEMLPLRSHRDRAVADRVVKRWTPAAWEISSSTAVRERLDRFRSEKKCPLLLVSTLNPSEREAVKSLAATWPGPVYCEGPSGLREETFPHAVRSGDRLLNRHLNTFDGVVRLGGVPTARFWRNLETASIDVLSISARPFRGLTRGEFFQAPLEILADLPTPVPKHAPELDSILALDQKRWLQSQDLLSRYPTSEQSLMRWLSEAIPPSAQVYVGNSLPIREWDLFAQHKCTLPVHANRGANGIDGQLSTALAFQQAGRELWVILGDLTALYDANALWFWKPDIAPLKLVVINNRGGRIFERLYDSPAFYNQHELSFKNFAALWNLPYESLSGPGPIPKTSCLLEIKPEAEATQAYWRAFDDLWA